MSDYSKYERKFDWNLADLEHNKITIGEYEKQFRAIVDEIRADTIDEVKSKMISFHTDKVFQYGADIIEAKSDAFDELKDWLKNQTT